MNQNEAEVKNFFECLGEIWRDITFIEFLMRCAIAKKEGEILKFPKPPYEKGKVYNEYPKSFSNFSFEDVVKKFNKYYPKLSLPQEFIDLRHAMAHGLVAKIADNDIEELVKFREIKNSQGNKELKVEFSMPLDQKRVAQIRQSLKELRQFIGQEVDDSKKITM